MSLCTIVFVFLLLWREVVYTLAKNTNPTVAAAISVPQAVVTSDMDGHYTCDNRSIISIRCLGATYAVHGNIEGQVYIGVGLRSGNVLAVTFNFPELWSTIYEIDLNERILHGKYTRFPPGGPMATETLMFSHELETNWNIGDAILGNWSFDPFWYPGTVIETSPEGEVKSFLVRFADGDEQWLGASRIMPDNLTVNDVVNHYGGNIDATRLLNVATIVHRDGQTVELESSDGRRETTKIEFIRTITPRETAFPVASSCNNIHQ